MSIFNKCLSTPTLSVKPNGAIWDSSINDEIGRLFEETELGWVFDSHDKYFLTAEELEAVAKWLKVLNRG